MPEYEGYDKISSRAAEQRRKVRAATKDPEAHIRKLEERIKELEKNQITEGDEFLTVAPPNIAFTGRIPQPQVGTPVVVTGNLNGLPAAGVALYQTTPSTI